MKILILGAGLVGGPMALDLAADKQFAVTVADINEEALRRIRAKNSDIKTVKKDLSIPGEITDLARSFDIVLNAVPGFMGYSSLEAIIKAGVNVVDIAFFPEDPFSLDELAREKGVTAIVDCGVAPGMSNVLIGYVDTLLDRTDEAIIYVGGLPLEREWPYEYKAVFSPIDVLEEYTRPARLVVNGKEVIRPALSEPELLDFPGIGTLEAFNSDGLRSLASTMKIPNMKEKTLRYPGHSTLMKIFRDAGFFSQEEIEVNGHMIRPLDLTTKLLFPKWQLNPGDLDITVMRILISGEKQGKPVFYQYDLRDRLDPKTGTHSMGRVTGYTATMAVRMVAQGKYAEKGIIAPEFIGRNEACVKFIIDGLKQRGVVYKESVTTAE